MTDRSIPKERGAHRTTMTDRSIPEVGTQTTMTDSSITEMGRGSCGGREAGIAKKVISTFL